MTSEHNPGKQIRSLNSNVLSSEESERLKTMLRDHVRARCKTLNKRDRKAWAKVKSRDDWEAFCAPRIEALKRSLGIFPAVPESPKAHVTRTIQDGGYCIENLFYDRRHVRRCLLLSSFTAITTRRPRANCRTWE